LKTTNAYIHEDDETQILKSTEPNYYDYSGEQWMKQPTILPASYYIGQVTHSQDFISFMETTEYSDAERTNLLYTGALERYTESG